ncbi:hypothetical protein ACJEQI_18890, partial [Klebsiella variicola]|uniref:hypothetical protein n=1 Tax=Klebsiella variicola TaxID=244366 RepID=UPI0038713D02
TYLVDTTLSDASDYDQTVHAVRLPLFCDVCHIKERYQLHLRQEIIMKLFHKIIAKFSVLSF